MVVLKILEAFERRRLAFYEALELLALTAGLKQVVRLTGTTRRLNSLAGWLKSLGLGSRVASFHLETVFSTGLGDCFSRLAPEPPAGRQAGVIFIGEPQIAEAAEELERNGCPAGPVAELYGYPKCCAENYETDIQGGHYWLESFLRGLTGFAAAPWPMNRFGRLFQAGLTALPDYFPCRLDCAASLELSGRYLAMLRDFKLSALVEMMADYLRRPVLHQAGVVYQVRAALDQDWELRPFEAEVLSAWSYGGKSLPATRLFIRPQGRGISVRVLPEDCEARPEEKSSTFIRFY